MKHCQVLAFCVLATSAGCVSYTAHLTGIVVEATTPAAVLADAKEVYLSGSPLHEYLPLTSRDSLITKKYGQVLRLEGSWTPGGHAATESYQALVGGLSSSVPGEVRVAWGGSTPYLEATSGWALLWGMRPHGTFRFMRAGVATSSVGETGILLVNEPGATAPQVVLVKGGPIFVECTDSVGVVKSTTLTLADPTKPLYVDVPDTCSFSPPQEAKASTDSTLRDRYAFAKKFSEAVGWPIP